MIAILRYLSLCYFTLTLLFSPLFSQASFASGTFSSHAWNDSNGTNHRYVVFEPEAKYSGPNPPVILFLNGFGENGSDGFNQARANFGPAIWEKRHRFPFLAVFPQCESGQSWSSEDGLQLNKAISILDEVIKDYKADVERIYVTGASSGGAGAWYAAARFPDKFAAAAPLCARIDLGLLPLIKESEIPVWNFCSEDERERLLSHNRNLIKELRDLGANPLYSETPGEGHNCWDYVYRMPALYEWFLSHKLSASQSRHEDVRTRNVVKDLDWLPTTSTDPPKWPIDRKSEITSTDRTHGVTLKGIFLEWQDRETNTPYVNTKWSWKLEGDGFWSGNQPLWESKNGLPLQECLQNELLLNGEALLYATKRNLYDNALLLNKDLSNRYALAAVKKFKDRNIGKQELFDLTRFEEEGKRTDKYSDRFRTLFDKLSVPKDRLLLGAKLKDSTDLDTLGYTPLIIHYRPMSSVSFNLNLASVEIDPHFYERDNQELIRFTEQLSDFKQRIYFVDPSIGYAVVKMEAYDKDKLVCSLEVDYSRSKPEHSSPSGWLVEHFHHKHDRWPNYLIATVEEIKTDKEIVTNELPQLDLSRGDAIFDRDSSKYYLVSQNGKKEEVHYSRIEELIAAQTDSSINKYYLVFTLTMVLLCSLIVLRKNKLTK